MLMLEQRLNNHTEVYVHVEMRGYTQMKRMN